MPETKESLLNLINASGFLFQLRVEQEIRSTKAFRRSNWEVTAREHQWLNQTNEVEGFIDLVLSSGFSRLVVECKKVTDANWVFLIPDGRDQMFRTRALWTLPNQTHGNKATMHDFRIFPPSPEATWCVVRGQGEKDVPMLERLSSLVIRSTESLANEEMSYLGRIEGTPRIYVPVIVTNATLHICRFDSSKVDISTGRIADADFEQVPCVRFRKSSSSKLNSHQPLNNIEEANQDSERTVLVINSTNLIDILGEWDVPYDQYNAPWPWSNYR